MVQPLYTPYYFRFILAMMDRLKVEFYEHADMVWHKDDCQLFVK